MQGWIVGLRTIAKYTNLSPNTVKLYKEKYGFPVYILPDGRYVSIISELNNCLIISNTDTPKDNTYNLYQN